MKPISNTWMHIDYPRGKSNIGYIRQDGDRQRVSMRGAIYSVQDLLESGYTFSPLVAGSRADDEMLGAMQYQPTESEEINEQT